MSNLTYLIQGKFPIEKVLHMSLFFVQWANHNHSYLNHAVFLCSMSSISWMLSCCSPHKNLYRSWFLFIWKPGLLCFWLIYTLPGSYSQSHAFTVHHRPFQLSFCGLTSVFQSFSCLVSTHCYMCLRPYLLHCSLYISFS